MYASLIGAGVSQLYDLYKSVTSKSDNTDTSFKAASSDDSSTGATAVKPAAGTGTSFSAAIQKLLVDLQNGTGASGNANETVSNDGKTLAKSAKAGHHAGPDDAGSPAGTGGSNPFGSLAASLRAYAKTQNLSASASTSLTA